MASIYLRTRSPFFWIKYRDPATGRVVRESTGIEVALRGSRRKAMALEAEWTRREMGVPRQAAGERFQTWAGPYLAGRYEGRGSLKNAEGALVSIFDFLDERQVFTPRQLTYRTAAEFVPWLVARGVHPNTARLRFVYLSILMSEAVRRGFIEANPCREVHVGKVPAKEKEEITPEHEMTITTALAEKKAWMAEQWLVLMRQGCRIAETYVPMNRVDERRMTITFRLKGGRLHTAHLHPDLLPLVKRAREERRAELIVGPKAGSAVPIWCMFFRELGMPYSAHCTRVTVITRLLRADHSPAKVCAFIGHTEEVNRIYRRLKPPDTESLLSTLGGGASPVRDSETRQIQARDRARRGRAPRS